MGFNVTEYEMFIDMVPDSKFQLSFKKLLFVENSLVVQSIRLCVSTAGGMGFTPGLVIKVQQAMQHGQNKCMRAHTHTHTHTHRRKLPFAEFGFSITAIWKDYKILSVFQLHIFLFSNYISVVFSTYFNQNNILQGMNTIVDRRSIK